MIRTLLLTALLATALLAYKDSAYLGTYGTILSGDLDRGGTSWDLENDGTIQGFRWGISRNRDIYALGKFRYEIAFERRAFSYKSGGESFERGGDHLSTSFAWGQNMDWLLNHEVVPYFRIGGGLGNFSSFSRGSNLLLGVGVVYTMRHFELTAGVDREFWQLGGFKIPYNTLLDHDAIVHNFHAGVNWRF